MDMEGVVSFPNGRGDILKGVLHHPHGTRACAAAILCHGMESSKESEKIVSLSRSLAQRGILTLRFDFSYTGESSGKFEDITYSGEVEDLRAAFNFTLRHGVSKVAVLGSSMGGTVGLLFAAQDTKVAALVTVSAPVHPEKITETLLTAEQVEQWRQLGYILYHGQRINLSLLQDLENIHVPSAAQKISCPVLIIHGDADETVPVEEAYELYGCLPAVKKLSILKGADHRLSDPVQMNRAIQESIDWFAYHLE